MIFAQAAKMGDQAKVRSTIQRLGKNFELMSFPVPDHLQGTAKHSLNPSDELAHVAAIGEDYFQWVCGGEHLR